MRFSGLTLGTWSRVRFTESGDPAWEWLGSKRCPSRLHPLMNSDGSSTLLRNTSLGSTKPRLT